MAAPRVLVAEDDLVNQKLAVLLLEQFGHQVDVVSNGRQALDQLDREAYDVALLDVRMPEVDGLEVARSLLERPDGSRPYLIAVTANAMQGDREKCLAAGMNEYLAKPIRPEALQAVLEHCGAVLAYNTGNTGAAPPALVPAAANTAHSNDNSPVDLERLMDLAAGDQEQLLELVSIYLRQTTEQIENIENISRSSLSRSVNTASSLPAAALISSSALRNSLSSLRNVTHAFSCGNRKWF